MNTKLTLLVTALVALCCASTGMEAVGFGGLNSGMGPPVRGEVLWEQNFNYIGRPRAEDWEYEIGNGPNNEGWGNWELQYYTDRNAFVENGQLVITARKEQEGPWPSNYTSSRLRSKKEFTYGVFEARVKLPPGNGSWGAFWMMSSKKPLNWPLDGELDILEHIGRTPGECHFNVHLQKYNHINGTGKGNMVKIDNVYSQFHTYTLDWNEHRVKFYVDDEEAFMFRKLDDSYEGWPYDNPMNIFLNSAVGGNWAENNVADELYPTRFEIEYVRQHAKNTRPEADLQLVSIKSVSQDKWLTIGNDAGGHGLVALVETEPNYPETFEFIVAYGGGFHLKSITTAMYLVKRDASLMANAKELPTGPEGRFEVGTENGNIRMADGPYWRTDNTDPTWPQIVPDASEEEATGTDASFQFELKMRKFL